MSRVPTKASDGAILLNIGCGSRFHRSWNNVDFGSSDPSVIAHDLTQGIPFRDCSFDAVYSAHFVEHVDRAVARFILRECFRVLKTGGRLRIVVPDLEYASTLYLESLRGVLSRETEISREHYEWAVLNLIDQMVRDRGGGEMLEFLRKPLHDEAFVVSNGGGADVGQFRRSSRNDPGRRKSMGEKLRAVAGLRAATRAIRSRALRYAPRWLARRAFMQSGERHRWMYDRYSVARLLEDAGFGAIRFHEAHTSDISRFAEYGLDLTPDGAVNKPHSLYVEALKPALGEYRAARAG